MDFLVIKVERCSRCVGAGIIVHPAWGRYEAEFKKRFEYLLEYRHPSPEEQDEFNKAFWPLEGYDLKRLPPEQVECPECNGCGKIRSEVPLEEALAELFARPPAGNPGEKGGEDDAKGTRR